MSTERIITLYDQSCSLCQETKKMMEKLDWFKRVDWISLQEYEKMQNDRRFEPKELRKALHVLDSRRRVLTGFFAARRLFILFPVTFFPGLLMYLPFAPLVGIPIYNWIAANRHKFIRGNCKNGKCSL